MHRRMRALMGMVIVGVFAGAAGAAEPMREFDNAAQRERYYELLERLRCLVCQNESLASSDADLAQDMRDEVYRLVVDERRSQDAAIEYLTERYGDFVLYRPPFQPSTWLLWLGPFMLLAIGAAVAAAIVRKRRSDPEPTLDPAERERAERLLRTDNDDEGGAQ
jgi:cytochrome c-type biogenesis protein CcmH